jgi:hypothetical protein
LSALVVGGRLEAQEATQDTTPVVLKTIEVTATSAQVPPPVELSTEVSAAVVQRQQSTNPYDLVRRSAGIEVHEQGQGPGWASDVVIRGFTSDHSSDVLLVLDGVPINLPIHGHVEGYSDWTILSPAAVSNIRVIHGPASPAYGNFALGGVIEVTSMPDATGVAASVGGSSYGDAEAWLRTGRHADRGGYLLAAQADRGQGWRSNSESWLGNLQLRGWRRLGRATVVDGGFAGYAATWNSPGFVRVEDYNRGRLSQATDPTDGGSGARGILSGRLSWTAADGGQVAVLSWLQVARSDVFLTIADDGAVVQQEERDGRSAVGLNATWRVPHEASQFTATVGGRADWDEYDLYHTADRERLLARQLTDGRYREGNASVGWRGLVGPRVQYEVALRADILGYHARNRAAGETDFRSNTTAVLSPKLGSRLLLGNDFSLLGSVSKGFRGAVGVITDPFQPVVTAWAKEIGLAYNGGRASAQLSLFQTDVRNERIQDPISLEITDAGTSRRRGVSAQVGIALSSRLRLSAEGTFNDARITGENPGASGPAPLRGATLQDSVGFLPSPVTVFHVEPLTPGSTIPSVARYLGRVGAEFQATDRIVARTLVRFSGPYTPIGEQGLRTRPYAVTDVGTSVVFPRFATLDVELQNALGAKYPEIRASGFINPGTPRTLRAALRFPARRN